MYIYIYTPPARAPSGSSDGFRTWAYPGLSRSLCSDQRPDSSSWRPPGSSALPYSAAPSASIAAAFSHRVRVVRRAAHLVRELHYSGTRLRGIANIADVVPLRPTGGAFAVYLQLTDKEKKSAEEVKRALLAAFAVDSFVAYEQFVARRLGGDESPDVFLADLRRLVSLFGGVSDKALRCAFVAGLPEHVRQPLRGGSRLEELNLSQVLARARAVITDDRPGDAREAFLGAKEAKSSPRVAVSAQRCYACGVPNHFARNCTAQRLQSPKKEDTSGSRNRARNYDRWRRGGKCASKASLQGNRVWEEA
ncbi:hypothetical protein M514_10273 [Trichuris suis]|uniref:CCHC-type domain-containing protein n=1 Tax=Trichuris suis TaxID=68888 RepID=A0A085LVB4_9BILA|nr:hypothetical protein M513_10273 [Trichuris suis]KFD60062.1 hypothetical protein M514_10273 [Trichuris suis]